MSAIKHYDEDWVAHLERISRHLRKGKFQFEGEEGITLPKGKGKGLRPVVMAPIDNRIVRRAMLEVLQGYGSEGLPRRKRWPGIPEVVRVMNTRTSIGGIKKRGVPHGLSLIDEAVRSGKCWFVRSDIKNFFTRIPLALVNNFIADAVPDRCFTDLFEAALRTNLVNKAALEERNHFILFPDADVGVAQGSALSALAANIALRDFDQQMNGRGIVCIRYIDDFIMLGPTQAKVMAAYASAKQWLKSMGMDVYDLTDVPARRAGKVDDGNIHDGTDVLGYRISAASRQPCSAATAAFLGKCDKLVNEAKSEMRRAAAGKSASHVLRYHQAMVMLHKTIWGWSQAFRHTTATQVFRALDQEIERRIHELRKFAYVVTQGASDEVRRRVMGVHLLSDTASAPLPTIPHQGAVVEARVG
ncbi:MULTISPECIES: reverse transcriptase domain-containing protein [unclassified Bradyrhizobium]|uniref:reverse transcriptase domain-containing protein n=1 Tax=unclassified Bradyrhizobium TaxID=2631580 RepID=UPI003393F750